MDQQPHNSLSSSTSGQDKQPHINHSSLSPSGGGFAGPDDSSSVGLGLDLDAQPQQEQPNLNFAATTSDAGFGSFGSSTNFLDSQQASSQQAFSQASVSDPTVFDPGTSFGQQPTTGPGTDRPLSFDAQSQPSAAYLSPSLNDGDFSLFPSGSQGDHFNAPLFEQPSLNPNDINSMTSPQSHHTPTPPNLLQPDSLQPGSAHQSPSFSQHNQFSSPQSSHSRNVSLGPEAALLPSQIGDWSQPQFQGHRRSPSEYSDVSSVSPSPNLVSADSFDDHSGHSPLQRASDGSLYQDVLNIESFSIGDSTQHGRSPSHSPAISPRLNPQPLPEMHQSAFGLAPPSGGFGGGLGYHGMQLGNNSFPPLASQERSDMSHMAPPAINIDFAPNNAKQGPYESIKSHIDQDSLTPPDRGMCMQDFLCVICSCVVSRSTARTQFFLGSFV